MKNAWRETRLVVAGVAGWLLLIAGALVVIVAIPWRIDAAHTPDFGQPFALVVGLAGFIVAVVGALLVWRSSRV